VPELDFMILAEHASSNAGVATVVGAGMDLVTASEVPVLVPIGIAGRVTFTPSECEVEHSMTIAIRFGSQVIGQGGGPPVRVQYPQGLPEGWPAGLIFGQTIQVPLTEFGVYNVDLRLDGQVLHTASFVVVQASPSSADQ
jgi:hypothetical protein